MPLNIANDTILKWVEEVKQLTNPKEVYFCDGTQEESDRLFQMMIEQDVCIKLKNRENSYYFRSDPVDVARVESKTYICSIDKEDAGPLNNWRDPIEMRNKAKELFTNAFAGRTMYVLVFSMGPIGSNLSQLCVQITDSPYVVVNARILARMGQRAVDALGNGTNFTRLLHATTNDPEIAKNRWPCQPADFFCSHYPDAKDGEEHVISFGSGYGGNALAKKSCLRLASIQGHKEGWLGEHMLVMGVHNKKTNQSNYLTCALPSACGKTNLAMMSSILPDELTITCLGDDMAWIKPVNGRLYAVNAENGFFGVAPGTNSTSNPNAIEIIQKDTIFTNVALYPDHSDVWFEGSDGDVPEKLIDWTGKEWTPDCGRLAAHPNSRFTSPLINSSILDPLWDDPQGVPIDGIIYGGRRSSGVPLVYQAFNVESGVYAGLTSASQTTAAQEGAAGLLRMDPFAMRPFLAYHVGDYVRHLLDVLGKLEHKPLIFSVNWFKKDPETNKFLWPGYCQNTRVLKWMVGRINGNIGGVENPLGIIPRFKDFDWTGLEEYTQAKWDKLMDVDPESMKMQTLLAHEQLFLSIGKRLPIEMVYLRALLALRF